MSQSRSATRFPNRRLNTNLNRSAKLLLRSNAKKYPESLVITKYILINVLKR